MFCDSNSNDAEFEAEEVAFTLYTVYAYTVEILSKFQVGILDHIRLCMDN